MSLASDNLQIRYMRGVAIFWWIGTKASTYPGSMKYLKIKLKKASLFITGHSNYLFHKTRYMQIYVWKFRHRWWGALTLAGQNRISSYNWQWSPDDATLHFFWMWRPTRACLTQICFPAAAFCIWRQWMTNLCKNKVSFLLRDWKLVCSR